MINFIKKLFNINNFDELKFKLINLSKPSMNSTKLRIKLISCFFSFFILAITIKLHNIVINNVQDIKNSITYTASSFRRSNIVDRNGQVLAVDLVSSSVYVNPRIIIDAKEAALKLSEIFKDLKYENLLKDFESNKKFVWIKRNISPRQKYAVNSLGLPGVFFEEGHKRIYPYGNLASHIVGYVGTDGMGLAGIEKYFDKELIIASKEDELKEDLQLSIDLKAQYIVHEEIERAFKEFTPVGAAAIVTDVTNGEIISMVSFPDFDPHHPNKAKPDELFNKTSLSSQELGSIFKVMTVAMALDSKSITMDNSYDVKEPIKFSKYRLRDYRGKGGVQNVTQIFLNSSNIGTAKISQDLGTDLQKKYMRKFGFFSNVNIEIPEVGGTRFPSDERWSPLSTMTISYGHGMMLTPMHFIRAFGGLVNNGIVNDLTLIKGKVTPSEQIICKKTSNQIKKLLRTNVLEGSGKRANAHGFFIGGKTGSAEKVKKGGGYSRTDNLSSFIATFPINNPKYAVLVILDTPRGNKATFGFSTGGWTAAPVAGRIISRIGHLMGVEPVNEDEYNNKYTIVNYKKENNESF